MRKTPTSKIISDLPAIIYLPAIPRNKLFFNAKIPRTSILFSSSTKSGLKNFMLIMRHIYIFITTLFVLMSACAISFAAPFDAGERLEYSLSWGELPAGNTIMEIVEKTRINGKEVFHSIVTTSSNDAIAYFYSLNNQIDTYIDSENFSTLKYKAVTRENKRKKYESATFNRLKKEITYEKNGKIKIIESASLVYDSIASIYYIRSLNLKQGERIKLQTFSGGKLFTSDVRYLKKEKITVNGVAYETIKLHSKTKEVGNSKRKRELFIWLTDNQARTPVMIKTKIKFGYITSELIRQRD